MKKMYTMVAIAAASFAAAQDYSGRVGVNTDRPKTTLDVNYSTNFPVEKTQAVTFPTITTAQRDAYRNVPEGATIYNITEHCLQVFNGTLWTCTDGSKVAVAPTDKCPNPVLDRQYGDGLHDFVYCEVTTPDGKVWLNNNLGADYTNTHSASFSLGQQATSFDDYRAYGSRFQYLRKADGHELMNWTGPMAGAPVNGTTTTKVQTVYDIGTRQRIISNDYSWYVDTTANTTKDQWNSAGANNPCPSGYHVANREDVDSFVNAVSPGVAGAWYADGADYDKIKSETFLKLTNIGQDPYPADWIVYQFVWEAGVGTFIENSDYYTSGNPGYSPVDARPLRCVKN